MLSLTDLPIGTMLEIDGYTSTFYPSLLIVVEHIRDMPREWEEHEWEKVDGIGLYCVETERYTNIELDNLQMWHKNDEVRIVHKPTESIE